MRSLSNVSTWALSALLGFIVTARLNLGSGTGFSLGHDIPSFGRSVTAAASLDRGYHDNMYREKIHAALLASQGLLRLRGGSRAQAAGRAKARYLAQKLSSQVDVQRQKLKRKMREKMIAQTQSPATRKQEEEERVERRLSMIEDRPFDPATDAESMEADERRSELFRSKYTPGQMVEIEDSEEWRRETEGDASSKMHRIDVFEDQTELIRAHNERHEKGISEDAHTETSDEWDNVRPDGRIRGARKVPQLSWGQASHLH